MCLHAFLNRHALSKQVTQWQAPQGWQEATKEHVSGVPKAAGGGGTVDGAAAVSTGSASRGGASGDIELGGAACNVDGADAGAHGGSGAGRQSDQKRQKKTSAGKDKEAGSGAVRGLETTAAGNVGLGGAAAAAADGRENSYIKLVDGEVIDESECRLVRSRIMSS